MAARSTGIFPREGFNLDAELEITDADVAGKVTFANAKTIRVIVLGLGSGASDGVCTVNIGGRDVAIAEADLEQGVGIAHVRGALCDADNLVKYTLSGTSTVVTGVFYELVD